MAGHNRRGQIEHVNGLVRAAVALWRLYFETGHRLGDFLIGRMTGSGRVLKFDSQMPTTGDRREAVAQVPSGTSWPHACPLALKAGLP
jgi:hypothetical protein